MTDTYRLRAWTPADAPVLAAAWTDPEIERWNPVPAHRSLTDAETWISEVTERPEDSPVLDLVMVDEHDRVLGELGLRISWSRKVAELGFWVGADHRRRGHGHRLLELASATADERGLHGLIAVSSSDNAAAIALFRSAGWLEVQARDGHKAFVDRHI